MQLRHPTPIKFNLKFSLVSLISLAFAIFLSGCRASSGDTIIIIKDGSTDLQIGTGICSEVGDGYKCDHIKLGSLTWSKNGSAEASCPGIDSGSKITVGASGGTGGSNDVVIKGNPDHVKINFDKSGSYPGQGNGHHHGNNSVQELRSDNGGICATFSATDHFVIKVLPQ